MNEYDFHLENGLQNSLDEALHYSYSVFPGSEVVKKQVPLSLF